MMQLFGLILQQQSLNGIIQPLSLVLIVGIFYVLVFMPMQKQKKQQAAMLQNLQSGNEVVTTGGIIGTIVSISGDSMVLRVKPDNLKLQVARSAVSGLVTEMKAAAVAGDDKKDDKK